VPAASAWRQAAAAKQDADAAAKSGAVCSRLTPPLPAAVNGLVRV